MNNYKGYFKGKKITVMGLGLLGRSIACIKFLSECGAILTVTDLKTKEQLKDSIKILAKYKNIKFVLGEHKLEDFENRDMILKSGGIPLDSIYIKEAEKNNIPVEMDASLFARLARDVTIVGVTGTRGKSMTTTLIYEILKASEKKLKKKIYIGGNVRGGATLPFLSKVKAGDIVVLELDSWQLQGFGEAKISPQISVFTSFMPDHMNYYKDDMRKYFADKANIFKYQKKPARSATGVAGGGDVLVIRPGIKKLIPKNINGKLIVANIKKVKQYDFIVPGQYQRENLACAVEVAKLFNIKESDIKKAVKKFKGVEGRLQYVKTVKGVKIYNDNNATTPEATVSGLEALGHGPMGKHLGKKNIVLIAGGADKGLDTKQFAKAIEKYCKDVILLDGTGTKKLIATHKILAKHEYTKTLQEAVRKAIGHTKKGDIVLFSPAFASFGMFTNEYDRNDQFMEIIKKLK